jgi:hypothetical protein
MTWKGAMAMRLTALAVLLMVASAAANAQVPSPRDVVTPAVYVSSDPAARGVPLQLAVVMKIRTGFHVNAREKSAEYLIATDLLAEIPVGFKAGEVVYPKGELHTFTFSKMPLNVYQGTVTLRLPITVLPGAATGEQKIPLKLRYQACSTEVCLPPVTIDLQAVVKVAANRGAAKAVHPEIFSAAP